MMINYAINAATEAVIYLKNGTRKHGILMDTNLIINGAFRFISRGNFNLFNETNNPQYIELLPEISIESINIDLK